MSRHKKILIGGALCIAVPISLVILHKILFLECKGDYRVFDSFLGYVQPALGTLSVYGLLLVPIGVCALLYGYFVWHRLRGDGLLSILSHVIWMILLILIFGLISITSLNTARYKGPNGDMISRMSALRAQAELYYDQNEMSYSGMCESDSEVSHTIESIRSTTFKQGALCTKWASEVMCTSQSDAYAAYVKLPQSYNGTTEYFCVDSTGFAAQVSKKIEGTVCPHAFVRLRI